MRMKKNAHSYGIFMEKPEGNKPIRRPRWILLK
jgi:hypothetical protein